MSSPLGSSVLAGAAVFGLGLSFAYRALQSSSSGVGSGNAPNFPSQHDPTQFRKAKLVSSKDCGAGAKVLKFWYEGGGPGFAPLRPLAHVTVRGKTFDVPPEYPFGLKVERDYTPISASKNEFELLVKKHGSNKPPPSSGGEAFSKYGLTSRFLLGLEPGKLIEVRGPQSSVPVEVPVASNGNAPALVLGGDLREAVQERKFVGMIAAGSGITPMLQLLKSPCADRRKFSVLWSNKTLDDVFYAKELDKLKSRDVSVRLTLTRTTPPGWSQDTGRVSKELLRARMPPPGPECLIIVT
ncbi:hypothetical protein BASA82_000079 [Batrachochytrium salamandrivorans]|nr:hypothetical protein BASA82_000079 [Batrachochytrium salamandrivorans]